MKEVQKISASELFIRRWRCWPCGCWCSSR